MASAKVVGMDKCVAALRALPFKMRERGLRRAVKAGAEIARAAVEQASPVGHYEHGRKSEFGPVKSSIITYTRRRGFDDKGDTLSMLSGPSKDAYYSYFLEHGWESPVGPAQQIWARAGRWRPVDWLMTTRRIARGGSLRATHSQQGLKRAHFIQSKYKDWIKRARESSASAIRDKMIDVFRKAVREA